MAKSSIGALRSRIGSAPLSDLVKRCCVPLADAEDHPQAFFAGLRLVAIDGSTFELPDEAENARDFGWDVESYVLAHQPKSFDWRVRRAKVHPWSKCRPLFSKRPAKSSIRSLKFEFRLDLDQQNLLNRGGLVNSLIGGGELARINIAPRQ